MKTVRQAGAGRVHSDIGRFSLIPESILDAPISDRAVRLFATLHRYADQNHEAFPNRRTLAKRLRTSFASVDRAIKELVDIGALKVTQRRDAKGDPTSNLYQLIMVRPGGVSSPVEIPLVTGDESGSPTTEETVSPPVMNRTITTGTTTTMNERSLADGLKIYEELFEQAVRERPAISSGDRRILQRLLEEFGEAKVQRALTAFFASKDEYVVANGYPLPLFASQINQFLAVGAVAASRAKTPKRPSWRDDCHHDPACPAQYLCMDLRWRAATEAEYARNNAKYNKPSTASTGDLTCR